MSVLPVANQTFTPLGTGILGFSPLHDIEDAAQSFVIYITVHTKPPAGTNLDRHNACRLAHPWC